MAGDYVHTDLGQCHRGDLVEVTLTRAANVRLLDSSNFNKYRRGQQHRYFGGLAKQSPVRLAVPRTGHWHVAVDMQGLRGTSRASVRKIPAESLRPLPRFGRLVRNSPRSPMPSCRKRAVITASSMYSSLTRARTRTPSSGRLLKP